MKIISWKRFLTFIAILILITISILYAIIHKERTISDTIAYKVVCGDTLWDLSIKYKPDDMSIQEYVYNLKKFNNIDSIIYPRQEIQILIYEEGK